MKQLCGLIVSISFDVDEQYAIKTSTTYKEKHSFFAFATPRVRVRTFAYRFIEKLVHTNAKVSKQQK